MYVCDTKVPSYNERSYNSYLHSIKSSCSIELLLVKIFEIKKTNSTWYRITFFSTFLKIICYNHYIETRFFLSCISASCCWVWFANSRNFVNLYGMFSWQKDENKWMPVLQYCYYWYYYKSIVVSFVLLNNLTLLNYYVFLLFDKLILTLWIVLTLNKT